MPSVSELASIHDLFTMAVVACPACTVGAAGSFPPPFH